MADSGISLDTSAKTNASQFSSNAENVTEFLYDLRDESEHYIADHPELSGLVLSYLISAVQENVTDEEAFSFAVKFFTDPNLKQKVLDTTEFEDVSGDPLGDGLSQ